MKTRVVITGLGCVSPLGNDVETSWNNLIAGNSGVREITRFDTQEFKCKIAAEVKGFDPVTLFGSKESRRMDRYTQFGLASAQMALQDSGLQIADNNRDRIGAVIGSGIGGLASIEEQARVVAERGPSRISAYLIPMMLVDSAGGLIAIELGIRGPNFAVVTACATGTNAIGEAVEVIRRGQADAMLAGGAEASILPLAIGGMSSMNAVSTRNEEPQLASRPFDKDRNGFVMGEGAAVLVLESFEHAQSRGARVYAEVAGYGSTNDAYHITAPADKGAGAVRCMQMALENAAYSPDKIDYINAHGTSTVLNDKNETAAIKTVFGEHAYKVPVSSTKSMTGHMMGASGALEALACVKALEEGRMPPTINYDTPDPDCDLDYVPNTARAKALNHVMSNSFGFGGHNATLILSKPSR